MKICKTFLLTVLSLIFFGVILLFEINEWPAGSSIAGIILGFSLPGLINSIQDLSDTTNWKTAQRKLMRGHFIDDSTMVRISFAYLYRIKIDNKYLLVKNERGTGKYQPVGGVYKLLGNEKMELRNRYQVKDDNKLPNDQFSRDDYRLRMENRYLRKFVRRFDRKAEREQIYNLGREFKEELIETGIVNWSQITYRFCGRHITDIHKSNHFQCYELLLADVVELNPTPEQEADLEHMLNQQSDVYCFATADEITSLGVNTDSGDLREIIADHTLKIIQENEGELMKISGIGKTYTINL